jgi:hypothetical protein
VTPREERVLFTKLVVDLLIHIEQVDWSYGKVEVAVDEWTVHSNRIYLDQATGERRLGIDRVHHPKGFHPRGLALDLLVYINGVYVTDGAHPIWNDLDKMARSLDAKLRFGLSFNDSNHLSFGEVKNA